MGLITCKTPKFPHKEQQSSDWVLLLSDPVFLCVSTPIQFTWNSYCSFLWWEVWSFICLFNPPPHTHTKKKQQQEKKMQPCPYVAAVALSSRFNRPASDLKPPLVQRAAAVSLYPCWAKGSSDERAACSSPFYCGAGHPPCLSSDHVLPRLRPPIASVLQQQESSVHSKQYLHILAVLQESPWCQPLEST